MTQTPGIAFNPANFLGLTMRNRFIRSATIEGMAESDGSPGDRLGKLYRDLADGGIGLISTGGCCPDPEWIGASGGQLVLNDKTNLSAWSAMAGNVHDAGALISLQMAPFVFLGGKLTGPSVYREGVVEITMDEINRLVDLYAKTAVTARRVGLDAVQVHGGHGYGLSQFLSPAFNQREDDYGGSPENRVRIFADIRKAIAAAAGEDFPVWIKMNALDGTPGGLTPDVAAQNGPFLERAGYAAIEVTGGVMAGTHNSRGPIEKSEWFEGFYLEAAGSIKAAVDLPVCAVGGIRKPAMIESILSGGIADLISLSRPLIREPGLVKRWAGGDLSPATCISCNGCFKVMVKGQGLYCVQDVKKTSST
jgi:2,4-dienoyl-CoA reductase-like NADH-dependent reductase (Old Yellow Enzyme family)